MMAGGKSRRMVGRRYEFPEDFSRTKRRGLLCAGGFIVVQAVSFMLNVAAGDLPSVAINLLAIVAFVGILGYLAMSQAPMVFEGDVIVLKGEAFKMEFIERMDVMIPRGKPGAKTYSLRLAFTIRGPGGHAHKEVKAVAKTDQALRMLSGLRECLPAAVICDCSGLLPAHLWGFPNDSRPQENVFCGPLHEVPPGQQRRLRISPADGDWAYPASLAPARDVALGHRGESHLARLRRVPTGHARTRIQCPSVAEVWS